MDEFTHHGIELRLEPIARSWTERLRQICRPRHHQIVIMQRRLLPVWQTAILRRRVGKLVYDFDDAIFLHDSNHPAGLPSMTRWLRFRAVLASADLVIAGNQYLAEQARPFISGDRIEVVPTCVNPDIYEPAEHRERDSTRIVWIGSSSTLTSLERAKPILEGIGQAIPSAELRVICDRFPRFEHLKVEECAWSSSRERDELRSSDMGLSWMPDDRWSHGKCGLKVLQYMAAGLPVVANPVGVHREIIEPSHGFLPANPAEWLESVGKLSRSRSLRQEMGQAGRQVLRDRFSVARWGPVLRERLLDTGRSL
jgi:glycosyltransferase involved in cell wall biosynthesis